MTGNQMTTRYVKHVLFILIQLVMFKQAMMALRSVRGVAQPSPICNDMKTVQGVMGNEIVSVLRDTWCTG